MKSPRFNPKIKLALHTPLHHERNAGGRQIFSSNNKNRESFKSIDTEEDSGLRKVRKNTMMREKCPRHVHLTGQFRGTNDPRNAPPGGFKGKYRICLLYPPNQFSKESCASSFHSTHCFQTVYTPLIFISSPLFRATIFFPSLSSTKTPVIDDFENQIIECHSMIRFYLLSFVFSIYL